MTINLSYTEKPHPTSKKVQKNGKKLQELPYPWTVGDRYLTGGRPTTVSYQIIEKFCDLYGWYSVDRVLPLPLDLVQIKTEQGLTKKGWYVGSKTHWEGYRLEEDEKIIAWRIINVD